MPLEILCLLSEKEVTNLDMSYLFLFLWLNKDKIESGSTFGAEEPIILHGLFFTPAIMDGLCQG